LKCRKCDLAIAPEDPIVTICCGSPSKFEKCEITWHTGRSDDRAAVRAGGEGRDYVSRPLLPRCTNAHSSRLLSASKPVPLR
jgi:hypothetical protein